MFVTLQVYSFPLSLPHGIYQIYEYNFCVCIIPNLAPWVNQYNNRDRDNKIGTGTQGTPGPQGSQGVFSFLVTCILQ